MYIDNKCCLFFQNKKQKLLRIFGNTFEIEKVKYNRIEIGTEESMKYFAYNQVKVGNTYLCTYYN